MVSSLTRITNFTTASECGKSLNELQINNFPCIQSYSKWIDDNKLVLNKKKILNLLFFVELGASRHN